MDPATLRYTKDHEWIGEEGGLYVVGITDHAQDQLGDITYIELPAVGKEVAAGAETSTVESVKAASDIYAPVGGKVAAVNDALEAAPELVNQDPFGEGWIFKLEGVNAGDLDGLMDTPAYQEYAANADH